MKKFTAEEEARLPKFPNLGGEGPRDGVCWQSPVLLKATLMRREGQEYLYVISDKGQLRIAESTTSDGRLNFHTDLVHSSNDLVIAAGEILIEKGRCTINNQSGSYKPQGEHLKDYVLSKILPVFDGKEYCVSYHSISKPIDTVQHNGVANTKSKQPTKINSPAVDAAIGQAAVAAADERVNQARAKVRAANALVIQQASALEGQSWGPGMSSSMLQFGDKLQQLSGAANDLGVIIGGQIGAQIASRGASLYKIGAGIKSIAKDPSSFNCVMGGLCILAGLVSFLSGPQDDPMLKELQQIHTVMNQLLQGQQFLSHQLSVMMQELREQGQINQSYLHSINTQGLDSARHVLSNYLNNTGMHPTTDELRKALSEVELWLKERFKAPITNQSLIASMSSSRAMASLQLQQG